MESAEFVARENLRRAEEYLAYSKKLATKGYLPEAQLEADQFAVEKKRRKELDLAMTKLEVLRVHSTRPRLTTLTPRFLPLESSSSLPRTPSSWNQPKRKKKSAIKSQSASFHLPLRARLPMRIEIIQVRGWCFDRGRKQVRERQTIIRLPNASLMRVRAKVNESRIEQVQAGNALLHND